MRKKCILLFLTFVLSLDLAIGVLSLSVAQFMFPSSAQFMFLSVAQAATRTPSPDFTDAGPDFEAETNSSEDHQRKKTIDIAPAPPPRPSAGREYSEFFYPFRKAITLRAGPLHGTRFSEEASADRSFDSGAYQQMLLGFQYQASTSKASAMTQLSYEAGIDLITDGTGIIHYARKYHFSRAKFRPYLKAGAGLRLVPEDRLLSFLRLGNYQLRGAAGFEQLLWLPSSVRLEIEAAVSMNSAQAAVTLGYVWAW